MDDIAHDLVLKSVDCFFTRDIKMVNRILEMQKLIRKERDKLMGEIPEIPNLRLIVWNITRIVDKGKSISLIALNDAFENKTKIKDI